MHRTNSVGQAYHSQCLMYSSQIAFPLAHLNHHPLFLFTWEVSEAGFVPWLFELPSAFPACLVTYSDCYLHDTTLPLYSILSLPGSL